MAALLEETRPLRLGVEPPVEMATLAQRMSMPVLPEPTAADRVARGIAYLDGTLPRWRRAIRLPVDIADASFCVLGQMYLYHPKLRWHTGDSNYGRARAQLRLSKEEAEAYGFLGNGHRGDYNALTQEWRRALGQQGVRRIKRLLRWFNK